MADISSGAIHSTRIIPARSGRAEGKDIVQIGEDSRGLKTRWRFTEITDDSFHWIGEERSSESEPWRVAYEHFAHRIER
jgi:hypothetical protein